MKKIIILQHNGGRLANQLWIYAKIYAFCLENNYKCSNPSFYEYVDYFDLLETDGITEFIKNVYIIFSKLFSFLSNKQRRELYLILYNSLTSIYFLNKSSLLLDASSKIIDLNVSSKNLSIKLFEKSSRKNLYFRGWNFINSSGLTKHQDKIAKLFQPKKIYQTECAESISAFRNIYKHVVGVHIRQTDYSSPAWRHLLISFETASRILKDYLKIFSKKSDNTLFIICSDTQVPKNKFEGLNVHLNSGSEIEDLITLSMCDVVIGSNSTYGAFASYLGNIPFIIMKDKSMDWEYYQKNTSFFCNKYSIMTW